MLRPPILFAAAGCLLLAAPVAAVTLDEARALHVEGAWPEALAAYREVAETAADPAEAATARNNACVIHNGLGEYSAALVECEAAIELRRGIDDDRRLARTLNNLAVARQGLGDYAGARAALTEALAINARRGDAEARVLNLSNLGALETVAGRYGEALAHHLRAAELASEHADEPWAPRQLEVAAVNRAVVLERLGAYREALEIYRGLTESTDEDADPRRRAQLELNLGVLYRNLGDPVRAVELFETVADRYRELDDPDGLSNALLNLALANHLNLGRWDAAERGYRQALELATRHGNRPEEIQDLYYLGRFLLDRGRLEEASEAFDRALAAAEASGSTEGRWSARAGLGRVAARRGDVETAIGHLSAAVDEIESVGAALEASSLRGGFFGERRPVYASASQVLAGLAARRPGGGYAERALEMAQRAKARALLDALGAGGWAARPLAAAELVRGVDSGVVVEYFVAESDLLRWTVGPVGVAMTNLGPAGEVEELARAVRGHLAEGEAPPPALLTQLATTLLGGLELPPAVGSRLFVATDGALRHLPFELLPFPGDDDETLLDRTTVSYLPSASALPWLAERQRLRGSPGQTDAPVLAFGDPALTGPAGERHPAAALFASRYDLTPLAAVGGELEALARRLPGEIRVWTGADATETALRGAAGAPSRAIHLATHAVVDERPGRGAAIVLAPDAEHDGLVEPREIAALDLPTGLTVLAACRTALDGPEGGALANLSGAFLAAGSSAVVATLWDVGDAATAVFMEQFYYQLGRGLQPAAALREAKLALRGDEAWSDPSLWAAYVIIGEAPPLASGSRLAPWLWVVALAAGVLVGWGLLAVRAARRRSVGRL